jgi:division protein CdvB (Snf7/Vps24/ESCRT-III family)
VRTKHATELSRIFDRTKLAESKARLDIATGVVREMANRATNIIDRLGDYCSDSQHEVVESLVAEGLLGRETVANLLAEVMTTRMIRKDREAKTAAKEGHSTVMSV